MPTKEKSQTFCQKQLKLQTRSKLDSSLVMPVTEQLPIGAGDNF